MDNLEKVEKLRQRANVSYAEAKAALEANGWDLLDAMVALEKQGKTESPSKSDFSTSYEQQNNYEKVQEKVEIQRKTQAHPVRSIVNAIRRFFRICLDNSFTVSRRGVRIFQMPVIVPVILLLINWKVVLVVMVAALFFGIRYSFEGKDNLEKANSFMNSAGSFADSMKEGFFEKDRRKAEKNAEKKAETNAAEEAAQNRAFENTAAESAVKNEPFETTAEEAAKNEPFENTAEVTAAAEPAQNVRAEADLTQAAGEILP